ncbi:MAG: hypothetical protein JST30_03940 [Armatimonadetes bacterium]|nr:hypothetical protein [Armatimonadota bacterium]
MSRKPGVPIVFVSTAALALAGIALAGGAPAVVGNVFLQDVTPGAAQAGHANIKGTFRAGQVFVQQASNGTIPVVGNSTTASPGNLGGSFSSAGPDGLGVRGTATAMSGGGSGVYGESRAAGGFGVRGLGNTGVFGQSNSSSGVGVQGRSTVFGTPGVIAENTVPGGDAAWFFGNVQMKGGNKIQFYDSNGSPSSDLFYFLLRMGRPNLGHFTGMREDRMVLERDSFIGGSWVIDSQRKTTLSATVKNFVEPDPDDPQRDIVYACIEGPEAAMYLRGTGRLVDGRAHVSLPHHFSALAEARGITVTLTPCTFDSQGLGVKNKSASGFDVGELGHGRGSFEFDWEVKAVRKGFADYQVYRKWDERMSPSDDRAKAYATRLQMMAEDRALRGTSKGP